MTASCGSGSLATSCLANSFEDKIKIISPGGGHTIWRDQHDNRWISAKTNLLVETTLSELIDINTQIKKSIESFEYNLHSLEKRPYSSYSLTSNKKQAS